MKENRRQKIEALIRANKNLSMRDLCQYLNVSMNTVRKDVEQLVQDGAVEKVYGGIIWKEPEPRIPVYENRNLMQSESKRRIAQTAGNMLEDGDVVFLDSGTTTMHVLDDLDARKQITVVTASIAVLFQAKTMENVRLMLLPGLYDKRTNAVLDNSTVEFLSRFKYTKAFIAASGLTATGELSVSNYMECELKRIAMERSLDKLLLVDSTKYSRTGLLTYGTIDQMHQIITDKDMNAQFVSLCQEKQIALLQV